jgi:hypothetical protein
MMSKTTDRGQRVEDPAAVTGDTPVRAEEDEQALKEGMRKTENGLDAKLRKAERGAADDASASRKEHRQNDAGHSKAHREVNTSRG